MDFISNLIKRPISLVLNETSVSTDKFAVSASLPNSSNTLDTLQTDSVNENHNQLLNINNRPLSMSSSLNGGNITDFIGVPDEFLVELEEFLPPPPPLTQSSPFNMSANRSLSLTPPPPPPPPLSLTSSMKASLTIDELLLEISDNLQQANLHDDVLALASPPNTELSPLSGKPALSNSKILTPPLNSSSATTTEINTPKTNNSQAMTAAAGTAASTAATVFEANSSIHKFHIDPELETGIFDDHQQQPLVVNNSGVNITSNKFVGLTEFDEAKIPELPGDLNPNIEEQYRVTFEKCFIPTLNIQQGTKDEFVIDKTHLLLPTETDTAVSSDNETFADCQDEDRDPLATTFAETASTLDTTTDVESFQSANNNTLNVELNSTMDNIADITMEAEGFEAQPQINQVVEELSHHQQQQQSENIDEDEPMDIDMNATIEIIQSSASNIQHVEKVLQHAENILQHIEEKRPLEEWERSNLQGLPGKQCETSTMTLVVNSPEECVIDGAPQHIEIEQSKHELSLNKSIELLPNKKTKTISSECIIAAVDNEQVTEEISAAKTDIENVQASAMDFNKSLNNNNLTIDCMNSSTSSTASSKSPVKNLNLTMNLTTSLTSQNSSGPSSPSFPLKPVKNPGFPRSPAAGKNTPQHIPYLEKSNYLENSHKSFTQPECDLQPAVDNLNGTYVESITPDTENQLPPEVGNNFNATFVEQRNTSTDESTNHLNDTYEEPLSTVCLESASVLQKDTCQILDVETLMAKVDETFQTTPELTLDAKNDNNEEMLTISQPDKKRLTFYVNSSEAKDQDTLHTDPTEIPIPSSQDICHTFGIDSLNENKTLDNLNVSNEKRRTFGVESTCMNLRRTFNVASEETAMDTSFEPMDVDDNVASPSKLEISNVDQLLQSPPLPAVQQRSQSPPLPAMQQKSQSPPLPTMAERSESPPFPTMAERSQSPSVPAIQQKSKSPPLPTMAEKSQSPPALPTMQQRSQSPPPPIPRTLHKPIIIKEEPLSPLPETSSPTSLTASSSSQHPFPIIQKRPSIHDHAARIRGDCLSLKEQSNIKVKDEKDINVEKITPSPIEDIFTAVSATSTTLTNSSGFSEFEQTSSSTSFFNNGEQQEQQLDDGEFGNNNLIFNSSDFDYLLTKGNNNIPVDRSSLLLKFDPLLGVPVPVNQGQQQQQQQLQQLQIPTNTIKSCLSPTLEEDEHNDSNRSFVIETKSTRFQGVADTSAKLLKERSQEVKQQLQLEQQLQQQYKRQLSQGGNKNNATMSVDVIKDMSLDNDCNKTFENSNSTQSDDKQINYKMDELEKKIKNEVLKTEDIEKKLKDAEQREEALIKRITEKDKTVSKMNGVIEAYEKAIAELIAEKEQLIQNYEKQLAEVKADRDSNYHHLTSLETTFSDLHVKYEKSKEMTCQLKSNEDSLVTENRQTLENLRLQEQRYDKMKNHAMQQLEIANKKLESLTRDHSIESTKLKALLKKEEIARSSINEQLTQKTKENAELVKICDELISGQGS